MLYIITIVLTILVGLNFLLLRFSCNKTTKKNIQTEKPKLIKTKDAGIHSSRRELAQTGS